MADDQRGPTEPRLPSADYRAGEIAERVKALLLRALTMTTASASTLASAFVETVNNVHLPACYAMVTTSPMHACAELLAASPPPCERP